VRIFLSNAVQTGNHGLGQVGDGGAGHLAGILHRPGGGREGGGPRRRCASMQEGAQGWRERGRAGAEAAGCGVGLGAPGGCAVQIDAEGARAGSC
jgi:hypothetical protein